MPGLFNFDKVRIYEFPPLRIGLLFKSAKYKTQWQKIYGKSLVFLHLGRYAVWQAVNAIRRFGKGTILMPSYHCGVEVEAVLRADMRVDFYNIKDNMQVDLQDLESRIAADTKAVFIIHYFGFPQPLMEIEALCNRNGIYLIEDLAHAMYSSYKGRFLGTVGDATILSIHKSLPIPSGGAVLFNNVGIKPNIELSKPQTIKSIRALLASYHNYLERQFDKNFFRIVLLFLLRSIPTRAAQIVNAKSQNMDEQENTQWMEFKMEWTNTRMSTISLRIMSALNPRWVIENRRRNYAYLLGEFSKYGKTHVVFSHLESDVCPLFFPIKVENRDDIQKKLFDMGISTFVFGKNLHPLLPEVGFRQARAFSKNILAIPIDQELTKRHLQYINQALKSFITRCVHLN